MKFFGQSTGADLDYSFDHFSFSNRNLLKRAASSWVFLCAGAAIAVGCAGQTVTPATASASESVTAVPVKGSIRVQTYVAQNEHALRTEAALGYGQTLRGLA